MNKPLFEMTTAEVFALWMAAYDFYEVGNDAEVKDVLDSAWEEFSKRESEFC